MVMAVVRTHTSQTKISYRFSNQENARTICVSWGGRVAKRLSRSTVLKECKFLDYKVCPVVQML